MHGDETGPVRKDALRVTAAALMAATLAEGFRTEQQGVLGTVAYFDLCSETTGLAPARQRYPGQPFVVFRCAVTSSRVILETGPEDPPYVMKLGRAITSPAELSRLTWACPSRRVVHAVGLHLGGRQDASHRQAQRLANSQPSSMVVACTGA